jgi:phosphoglycerate dehydrogenase-like enzyme
MIHGGCLPDGAATFINTACGAIVREDELVAVLRTS